MYVLGTNSSPLEQPALLSMGPSLQTLSVYFKSTKKHYCFVESVYLYIPPIVVSSCLYSFLRLFLPICDPCRTARMAMPSIFSVVCLSSPRLPESGFGCFFFNLNSFIFPVNLLTFLKSMLVSFLLL